jgi:hypothetical protein
VGNSSQVRDLVTFMQSLRDLELWIGKEGENRESPISLAQDAGRSNEKNVSAGAEAAHISF